MHLHDQFDQFCANNFQETQECQSSTHVLHLQNQFLLQSNPLRLEFDIYHFESVQLSVIDNFETYWSELHQFGLDAALKSSLLIGLRGVYFLQKLKPWS